MIVTTLSPVPPLISNTPFSLAQADRIGNEDTLIVDKRFYSMDSCNKDNYYSSPDSSGDDGRPYGVFLCIVFYPVSTDG